MQRRAVLLSFVLQLGLILYADQVDSHPERYGGLKYTDVDWRVVTDGSWLIFHPSEGNRAVGWLVRYSGWQIGDPYNRSTFRYTPLLPLLLSPHLLHPILGKLTLVLITLLVPVFLPQTLSTTLLWTLNPFVLNITTRGSPESPVLLLVAATLWAVKQKRFDMAAISWAASVAWKIYPIIYAPVLWIMLSRLGGWFGGKVWRFAAIGLGTFILLNGVLWSIWGYPFLHHTFLYHLTRLDHRHNFSPYFYPIYLALGQGSGPAPDLLRSSSKQSTILSTVLEFNASSIPATVLDAHPSSRPSIESILRHPLASFVPQFGLVALAGFLLTNDAGPELAVFVQTATFVAFNKVCTSQYYMWFLPLLPPLLPKLNIPPSRAAMMLGLWVLGQAAWLGAAYLLELRAQDVFDLVWAAGILLFAVSCWVLGEVLEGFQLPRAPAPRGTLVSGGKRKHATTRG